MIIWFAQEIEDAGDRESIDPDMTFEEIRDLLKEAAEACLEAEDVYPPVSDGLAIGLSFVDEEEIRRLNREFRQVDKVTDVLSFPMMEGKEEILEAGKAAAEGDLPEEAALGDVVICTEMIRKQAAEYGHSRRRELVYLFVHSMLHLLGYDHMQEQEKRIMRKKEEEIMGRLGIHRQM